MNELLLVILFISPITADPAALGLREGLRLDWVAHASNGGDPQAQETCIIVLAIIYIIKIIKT